ncbi:MAG: O-methyltransferase [Phenylobacterium sp.]|jgi:predicted O-methyltransferase YrrM|nr:O-methyltransferase [Phenylobacterium sp.]
MSQDAWNAVDGYLVETLLEHEPVLEQALADSAAAGLPAINVAPNQGKLLRMLAEMQGARRILEIGTLGGYSTIWLGRALPPDGRLVSLEYDPRHAQVARANLDRAGLTHLAEVRVGRALDLLPDLEGEAPFDFVFIDADKPSNPDYFAWALKLTEVGSVIVVDNVVRAGAVVGPGDAAVRGVRKMMELIGAEPRVTATAVQTVGAKGWDGFCLIRVVG